MEQNKKLKIFLMILIVVLISIVSFGGIYVESKGGMENVIPEYKLARDLKGYRRVEIALSEETKAVATGENETTTETAEVKTTEEKVNKDEDRTSDNYSLAKSIIEKRLKDMYFTDYVIRQNTDNGTIILELPETNDTDRVVGNLYQQAKFEMVDNDTNEVLLTNDDIKSSISGYTTTSSGTPVILINIEFNDKGTEKFKEITSKYTESEETDETDGSVQTKTKEVNLKIDDTSILTTHFDKQITNGIMQLTMSVSTSSTTEEIQNQLLEANTLSTLLGNGKLPFVYEVNQNKFVFSDIDSNIINIVTIVMVILAIAGTVFFAVKYKAKGVLGGIGLIGFVATLLFVIRYTNVEVSIGGLVLMVCSVLLNKAMIGSMLKKENAMEAVKEFALILVPALIIAIVFTLTSLSIGAMLFWIVAITLLFNLAITKTMIK